MSWPKKNIVTYGYLNLIKKEGEKLKFRECEYCGSSLDFGEKCDCKKAVEKRKKLIEYQNKAVRYSGLQRKGA